MGFSSSPATYQYFSFYLLHYDVRCREENGQSGDNGEHGENEEADAIDDHSGKLPFGNEIVFVVFLFQLGRDEAQLSYDRLQVPLSLLSRINKRTDKKKKYDILLKRYSSTFILWNLFDYKNIFSISSFVPIDYGQFHGSAHRRNQATYIHAQTHSVYLTHAHKHT